MAQTETIELKKRNVAATDTLTDEAPANAALAFSEGIYRNDGGKEAWSVICGCSTIFFFFIGILYSWGVIQDNLQRQNVASPSILALIGSMGAALEMLLAIPASRLCSRIGNQLTACIGSFLVGLGLLLASFTTTNVVGLFLTMGATYGVGTALCYISCGPLPAQWFKKKRGLATGITFASGGFGGFCITLALSALSTRVGLSWALRAIALLNWAACIPASYLVKPRFTGRDAGKFNLSLFRETSFVLLFIAGFLGMFPLFVVPYFIPTYARAINLSSSTGAWLLAGYNLSSAFGRLMFGVISDRYLGPLNATCLASTLMAVSMMTVWSVSNTIGPLILFVVLNGIAAGAFFALFTPVVSSIFTSSPVTTTVSLLVSAWSVGYFTGGPISGAIVDSRGGPDSVQAFRPAILFAGSLATLSAILNGLVRYRQSGKLLSKL